MDLKDARIAVLAENQYQELELWYPVLRFREEGADVTVVGPRIDTFSSKLGYPVVPDVAVQDVNSRDFDAVIVPGGFAPEGMRRSPELIALVRDVFDQGGVVAAICHAGWVLASSGIAKGRRATCVPIIRDDVINAGADYVDEPVVRDGNLITSRLPSDLPVFCREIRQALVEAEPRPQTRAQRVGGRNSTPEFQSRAYLVPDARGAGSPNYATVATSTPPRA